MSPDFKFQLVSLLKLCTAVIEHGNESPEANAIREAMDDGSWYRLSVQEQEELRSLSAEIDDIETRTRPRGGCRCGVCQECNWAARHET